MNKNDLFFEFIYKNNGYLTPDVFSDFMQCMMDDYDNKNEKYMKLREEVMHLKNTMLTGEDMVLCKETALYELIINYLSLYGINDILELKKKFTIELFDNFSYRTISIKIPQFRSRKARNYKA
jgi:hypothetical protein